MSGGPVFNSVGELIAIHGRGDFQEKSKTSVINEIIRIKTGFNLGITLSTVLKLSSSLGLTFPTATVISPSLPTRLILDSKPKSDDYFLQGVDRFRSGEWAVTIAMMDKAIQLNPKYLRACTAGGPANFMLNRLAKGLEDMETGIAIDCNYLVMRTNVFS